MSDFEIPKRVMNCESEGKRGYEGPKQDKMMRIMTREMYRVGAKGRDGWRRNTEETNALLQL